MTEGDNIDRINDATLTLEEPVVRPNLQDYARTLNFITITGNGQCIEDALQHHIIQQYHLDIMTKKGLLDKYGIAVEDGVLTLPNGMRFECPTGTGIVYLIEHDEIIYDMDYRLPRYDMPTPRELAPYPYKDDLERRANEIWVEQGRPVGRSLEHWIQAKHEWHSER